MHRFCLLNREKFFEKLFFHISSRFLLELRPAGNGQQERIGQDKRVALLKGDIGRERLLRVRELVELGRPVVQGIVD